MSREAIGAIAVIVVVVVVIIAAMIYEDKRDKRHGLHSGVADPFDIARKYRSRSVIEEQAKREQWAEDHPGEPYPGDVKAPPKDAA